MSLTTTCSAILGPLFTIVIVQTTLSYLFGVRLFTFLTTATSASGGTTVPFSALLLYNLGSCVVEFTVTVLIMVASVTMTLV